MIGIVGINKGIRSWNELSLEVTSVGRGLGKSCRLTLGIRSTKSTGRPCYDM